MSLSITNRRRIALVQSQYSFSKNDILGKSKHLNPLTSVTKLLEVVFFKKNFESEELIHSLRCKESWSNVATTGGGESSNQCTSSEMFLTY